MADLYSVKTAKNGRIMYYKNGRLTKKESIPEDAAVRDLDFELETVDATQGEQTTISSEANPEKTCVFEDGPGDFVRFVNGQYVNLCDDHYHNSTLGKIVQQIRELSLKAT